MTTYLSENESQTMQIASRLSSHCQAGTVIALYGTLGAGKTAFARGFIQALNPRVVEVPSPTFTLLQTYDTPDFDVYHFDMYRLKSPAEAFEIGIEDAFSGGVSLIEWPEKIGSLLPKKHIRVDFEITDNNRLISITEQN